MSIVEVRSTVYDGIFLGAIMRGGGTCGAFQSFLVISAVVPCMYYVHRDKQCNSNSLLRFFSD